MANTSHSSVVIQWRTNEVQAIIANEMRQRVRRATALLKGSVLANISKPVGKTFVNGKLKKERSKPGEFPRRDLGKLIATMMSGMLLERPGLWSGYVGTPLDYGEALEISRDRSFLVRTLFEKAGVIQGILTAPIKDKP